MRAFNKLQLPSDFAQRLLDNQIEFKLAEKPSSDVICNLIELYSRGVEYYESIKSHKYLYFKKKMTQIFSEDTRLFKDAKKEVEEAEGERQSPISRKLKSKNEEERIEALKIKQKQQKLEIELNQKTKTQTTKKEAEKLIRNIAEKEKMMESKIKSNLESQDRLLEHKLMQRKKRSFCKSFSAFGLTEGTETKESLFLDQSPNRPNNERGVIEPLMVNFESVINDEDSDQEDRDVVVLPKKSIIAKGRMASMGRF